MTPDRVPCPVCWGRMKIEDAICGGCLKAGREVKPYSLLMRNWRIAHYAHDARMARRAARRREEEGGKP